MTGEVWSMTSSTVGGQNQTQNPPQLPTQPGHLTKTRWRIEEAKKRTPERRGVPLARAVLANISSQDASRPAYQAAVEQVVRRATHCAVHLLRASGLENRCQRPYLYTPGQTRGAKLNLGKQPKPRKRKTSILVITTLSPASHAQRRDSSFGQSIYAIR